MKKQLINGQWCDASNKKTWNVINPANEEIVATVPYGDGADCYTAIEAAVAAFPSWSNLTSWMRADLLKKTADIIRKNIKEYAAETILESGKPMVEAQGEWRVAANLFEWFAEEGKRSYGRVIPSARTDKRMSVIYQPMGVIGIITAWNFPAYNPARACAAALAAGCTIVCKGSEYTPLTSMNLFAAMKEAGIPDGVANLVNGESDKIGQAMLDHPKLKKISFTGSTRVGKILMDGASKTNTKLALELGGNAPVIIMDDVDVEHVAKTAVNGRFRNAGQVCNIPQRFYVHRKIYDQFLSLLTKNVSHHTIGDGFDESVKMGPMINKNQQQAVLKIIEEAKREGAEITIGGGTREKGFFIEPTVIADRKASAKFYEKEIFGPVLPVIPFDTLEEVIEKANNTQYGLAAFIWTNNLKTAIHLSEKLEFGMVGVNEWIPHATEAPFGGWKQSGIGHESGSEGLYEYMEKKLIS
ncbi:MAG: NAD-dependent succinate-semialdehyde dehydrogenase, partial [Chitinophagales bacterium]